MSFQISNKLAKKIIKEFSWSKEIVNAISENDYTTAQTAIKDHIGIVNYKQVARDLKENDENSFVELIAKKAYQEELLAKLEEEYLYYMKGSNIKLFNEHISVGEVS